MSGADDATVPQTPGRLATDADRPSGLPDRYQLKEVIGSGGMGKVYRAHDTTLGRDVAVKVLDSAPGGSSGTQPRDRFVREARAAARLAHPNIVAVHDADPDAGWLVMDLVEGQSLRDIAQRGPVPPRDARAIAEQVLAALDAAHASGVIHRDIKPSNIIVDSKGKVTLVDFGVARLVDAEVTRTGESLGTPAYMAPEQLRGGKVDERTDLYGLAATLFELVSGERMIAFETPSAAALAKVKQACHKERGLSLLITRCLQSAPEHRVGSAREAAALLAQRRGRGRLVIAAVAALVIVLGAGFAAWHASRKPADDPRKRELFALSQRGEHEKAELFLRQYVDAHPADQDARMMMLLNTWWNFGMLDEHSPDLDKLSPLYRDMLRGIAMIAARKEAQAIAYLEDAEHRYPNRVEIQYALGEARWHGQEIERGVQTLEHAFELDPRWQMALHHVFEYRLSRGETAGLAKYVTALRTIDQLHAAVLECEIAIADRHYEFAARVANAAIDRLPASAELYTCLLQAQVLANDLAAAEHTAQRASANAPIDLREWGLRTHAAELLLYRGKLADYLANLPDSAIRQSKIALALWHPSPDLVEQITGSEGPRGQPIVPASVTLVDHAIGGDAKRIYEHAFEAELRAFGRGLAAELHGDLATAAAELRRAVDAPAKGDVRMLAAHALAHVLYTQGDKAGAKAACEEVIHPHAYQAYRAALLPDCVLWSGDVTLWRQLAAQWTGEFQHPAVVQMRASLSP